MNEINGNANSFGQPVNHVEGTQISFGDVQFLCDCSLAFRVFEAKSNIKMGNLVIHPQNGKKIYRSGCVQ